MKPPRSRNPRLMRGNVSIANVDVARSLAYGPADNYGKSRAQVLESGGRVDKGTTSEARSLDGADDSGRNAHRARSVTRADSGGLKLSGGRASNPGCRSYGLQYPRQGKMNYGGSDE